MLDRLAAPVRNFSRVYGNLSDQDRIFTNLYEDESPFLDGALKRVLSPVPYDLGRLASDEGHLTQWRRLDH